MRKRQQQLHLQASFERAHLELNGFMDLLTGRNIGITGIRPVIPVKTYTRYFIGNLIFLCFTPCM
jgi:hypothetical protein